MIVRPGSHIWERTDNDGYCAFGLEQSTAAIYEQVGRGNDTLSIMESDMERGAGWFLEEDDQTFQVEKVIYDPENLDLPVRVISHERPPFGEWRVVDDE